MRALTICFSLAWLGLAGCFTPKFNDGIACDKNGACPPGFTCGSDNACHKDGTQPPADAAKNVDAPVGIDARVDAMPAPDARPDAMPVECTTNSDCQTPPDKCSLAGTCNLNTNKCEFPQVDCSSMDSECAVGMCNFSTGKCEATPANDTHPCGLQKECGPFGQCGSFSDTCDESGSQQRTCHDFVCVSGTCMQGADYQETAACARDQTNVTCKPPTTTNCDPTCSGFTSTCDESGTKSCTCTSFACQSGTCTPSATTCTKACSRDQTGVTCGTSTTTNCTTCDYGTNKCSDSGSKTCTCTNFKCSAGSCQSSSSSCNKTCTRDTTGNICGQQSCGGVSFKLVCCNSTEQCSTLCSACQQ